MWRYNEDFIEKDRMEAKMMQLENLRRTGQLDHSDVDLDEIEQIEDNQYVHYQEMVAPPFKADLRGVSTPVSTTCFHCRKVTA